MSRARKYLTILLLLFGVSFGCTLLIWKLGHHLSFLPLSSTAEDNTAVKNETGFNVEHLQRRETFSILGEWLCSPEGTPPPQRQQWRNNNDYAPLILVWKYGAFLEQRHAARSKRYYYPTSAKSADHNREKTSWTWQRGCSVRDCRLTYRDEDLSQADAIVFHLHLTKGIDDIPSRKVVTDQIWIFMSDESPLNTFLYEAKNPKISAYDDIFDWSMTYREDSDVPVPYGRTIKKRWPSYDKKRRSQRNKLVAIMGSNCSSRNNKRWKYARELGKWLRGANQRLDVYGRCLDGNTTACPGHFHHDCPILASYKFYLAFENSNCREYITEKVYWNAYEKGSVPIIMGASRQDCVRLLPPRSFIHVENFLAPRYLADYLVYLDENDDAYDEYHQWRDRYLVINEHGYFGSGSSRHYCRVCEALWYNIRLPAPTTHRKYRRIGDFWNSSRDCTSSPT